MMNLGDAIAQHDHVETATGYPYIEVFRDLLRESQLAYQFGMSTVSRDCYGDVAELLAAHPEFSERDWQPKAEQA